MLAVYPQILRFSRERNYEAVALLARRTYGGQSRVVARPDLVEIVKNAGIEFQVCDNSAPGSVVADDRGGRPRAIMRVPPELTVSDERFLLAHLLGHFCLHILPAIADHFADTLGFDEPQLPSERYLSATGSWGRKDSEADAFALHLLLPRQLVLPAIERVADRSKLEQLFGLDFALIERRIQDLNGDVPEAKSAATKSAARPPQPSVDKMVRADLLGKNKMPYQKAAPDLSAIADKEVAPRRPNLSRIREIASRIDKSVKP